MIQIRKDLFLLPKDESIQGSIGLSSDLLFQHTFHAWVQYLDSKRVKHVNLGVLGVWDDDDFVEILKAEDFARRKIYSSTMCFAKEVDEYYYIDEKTIEDIRLSVDRVEGTFVCDYFKRLHSLQETVSIWDKPYYCGFVDNMFGIPIQFVRQRGENYYFVQRCGETLFVPNIVTLESSHAIISGYVQKMNTTQIVLWKDFCLYMRKTFGLNIKYGKAPKNIANRTIRKNRTDYRGKYKR